MWKQAVKTLRFLFDASHNGLMVVDESGLILVYNRAAGKVMKRDPDLLVGRAVEDVLPQAWPDIRRILRTGNSQIGLKLTVDDSTIVANRTPIQQNGDIVGVISIFQDISEYEKIITELETYRRVTRELDAIIDSSYDGLYVTDGHANTLRVNRAYERISGIGAENLIGKNMKELVQRGFFDQSVSLEVLRTRKPVTIMQEVRGGKKVMVTGNPIFNDDGTEIMFVVTNVRDVSELDHLRKELEDSRQISEKYLSELRELRLYNLKSTEFIAESAPMRNILRTALKVAKVDATVLITGESGTGKGLLARMIHNHSDRARNPFIKINCGAIPEALLESELFGYETGAFTGAKSGGKPGLFEVADGGTIFLDEIGDLPFHLQVKLLSILEDMEVTRLGGTKPKTIDVRVLAASNRDLELLVRKRKFREDLFFRLNVIPIHIPPLRERREDIFPLIHSFLGRFNDHHGQKKTISAEALDLLMIYGYPGNIRELQNIIERLVVTSESDCIGFKDLPFYVSNGKSDRPPSTHQPASLNLNQIVQSIEARLIEEAIARHHNTYAAARHLGVSQSTVVRKMQKYQIRKNNAQSH
ncbi:MAG: sigma 54-interacting transcriptional regulator [Deltaproteobacteria bacterium]|nr:sigma 54-interacting transcriptional regulator [Deltaproteobacteria bacterium]